MSARPELPRVSIVVPVLDEVRGIAAVLGAVPAFGEGSEVLVVDGGSTDGSLEAVEGCREGLRRKGLALQLLAAEPGRAVQQNAGAAAARGDVLLFLHADTLLPEDAPQGIARALARNRVVGGGFRHSFRERGLALGMVSAASNLRARLGGALYGDQAIFIRTAAFRAIGGFRRMPIFEDADLAIRMRRAGRVVILGSAVRTSGRRFLERGILRTALRNQRLKLAWRRGADPARLAADYASPARDGRGLRGGTR